MYWFEVILYLINNSIGWKDMIRRWWVTSYLWIKVLNKISYFLSENVKRLNVLKNTKLSIDNSRWKDVLID